MALKLTPYSYTPDGGFAVSGFTDQFGQNWRQTAGGGWERVVGQHAVDGGESQGVDNTWGADDPLSAKWGLQGNVGFDVKPYQKILEYLQGAAPHFGDPGSSGNQDLLREWMSNPVGIFDSGYNPVSRNSLNPYGTTGVRDSIRDLAVKLGLTSAEADEIALSKAQSDFNASGQGRSDATAVPNLADDLARAVFEKAGKGEFYKGLTPEQRNQYGDMAIQFQGRNKEADSTAWKRDDFGGMAGLWMEQVQSAWEHGTNDGWMPSEQALAGADNPLNTALWNKALDKEWEPYGNEYGLPTDKNYKQAQAQGYETGAASILQTTIQRAMSAYLSATGATGELTGMAGEAAGLDPSYLKTAQEAKQLYGLYQLYQKLTAGAPPAPPSGPAAPGIAPKGPGGRPMQKRMDEPEMGDGIPIPGLTDVYAQYQQQQGA